MVSVHGLHNRSVSMPKWHNTHENHVILKKTMWEWCRHTGKMKLWHHDVMIAATVFRTMNHLALNTSRYGHSLSNDERIHVRNMKDSVCVCVCALCVCACVCVCAYKVLGLTFCFLTDTLCQEVGLWLIMFPRAKVQINLIRGTITWSLLYNRPLQKLWLLHVTVTLHDGQGHSSLLVNYEKQGLTKINS